MRLIPHTDEEEATDKIAAGLVLYPLAWAARGLGRFCDRREGRPWSVFLVALLPTGFFALAWRERLEHVGQEARAFARFLRDRELPHRSARAPPRARREAGGARAHRPPGRRGAA